MAKYSLIAFKMHIYPFGNSLKIKPNIPFIWFLVKIVSLLSISYLLISLFSVNITVKFLLEDEKNDGVKICKDIIVP